MEELIEEAVKMRKEMFEEARCLIYYTEEDIRLMVYEDLRDNLKVLMSDVSY
jgi:hypothetical protein